MRKKLALAALLALVAPAIWLGSTANNSTQEYSLGLGKQVAGGWLATLDLGYPVDVLISLMADGNFVVNGQLRWAGTNGTGGWMSTRYNTTSHGSWNRTGPNGIDGISLLQVQDNDGNLVFYEKVTLKLTFDKPGTSLQGSGTWSLYELGVDPLDPDSPRFAEGTFTATGRRIQ